MSGAPLILYHSKEIENALSRVFRVESGLEIVSNQNLFTYKLGTPLHNISPGHPKKMSPSICVDSFRQKQPWVARFISDFKQRVHSLQPI